jgi:hypothetical protein
LLFDLAAEVAQVGNGSVVGVDAALEFVDLFKVKNLGAISGLFGKRVCRLL